MIYKVTYFLNAMIDKKYIKKVIVTDEVASADARGERLRKIRNLANLSRKELCNTSELKLNTYKGWELGRFGGLPVDGAERVIKRVTQENVICSVEWLLYGKGQEPYVIPQKSGDSDQLETQLILKEIMVFQSFHPDAIYIEIKDDALSPLYIVGDYVAGIRVLGKNISSVVNQVCIVQLTNGEILCRYLREGYTKDKYQLLVTNINSNLTGPQTIEAELNFAAPIARHYKPVSSPD